MSNRLAEKAERKPTLETPAQNGRVVLVGAGPGDPELLTVKALKALQACDVVLYDALVSSDVLALATPTATRISVGKRAGAPSWRQDDIHDLMIRLAERGRFVVRLKAGDPSVFGRSGEEIAALSAAGIPASVIPGITTASAMAANLGASLTHRASARSLRFVTASSAKGGLPADLDWHGLADTASTLIVYMARRTGQAFARALIEVGRSPATPVVIAEAVSRADEQYRLATLGDIAHQGIAGDKELPLTLGIGDVFAGLGQRAGDGDPLPMGEFAILD